MENKNQQKPITEDAVNAAIDWIQYYESCKYLEEDKEVLMPEKSRLILREYKMHQYEDFLSVSARILLEEIRRMRKNQNKTLGFHQGGLIQISVDCSYTIEKINHELLEKLNQGCEK